MVVMNNIRRLAEMMMGGCSAYDENNKECVEYSYVTKKETRTRWW